MSSVWSKLINLAGNITGVLPLVNGGTGTAAASANAAFNALSPMSAAGDIIYGGASGVGTRLAAGTTSQVFVGGTTPSWGNVPVAALPTATATALGATTSYFATIQSAVKSVASSGYAIQTADGYQEVLVTTGAASRTITLPTVASNTGRVISVKKVDSGAGGVVVTQSGSETIDGNTTYVLNSQYDYVVVATDGSNWYIVCASPNPLAMQNAQATRLGLMEYLHGTTYNSGIAPTVTSSITGLTVIRAAFVPYLLNSAGWRMRFNMVMTHNSSAGGTFTVNGVTFKNVANYNQAVAARSPSGIGVNDAYAQPGVSTLFDGKETNETTSALSGDVELDSAPTWAYTA